MESKPKIAIVSGVPGQRCFFNTLARLSDFYEFVVFAFRNSDMDELNDLPLRVCFFEPLADMPGYMRGLETELGSYDGIIGVEASSLSAFQALRSARVHGKPFGVIVNEFRPYFYADFVNIRAIQQDIYERSQFFWVTSEQAATNLCLEGIKESQINPLIPNICSPWRTFSENARTRFRRLCRMSPDQKLIAFVDPLTTENRAQEPLLAVKTLLEQRPELRDKIRLLYVGEGPLAEDIKYRSVDFGLGGHVIFLQQDFRPFANDLACAMDLLVCPKKDRSDIHEAFPSFSLEAMAVGTPVIGYKGSVSAEFIGNRGHILVEDSYQSLVLALENVLSDTRLLDRAKIQVDFERQFVNTNDFNLLSESFARFLASGQSLNRQKVDFSDMIIDWEQRLKTGDNNQILVEVEESLIGDTLSGRYRSELLRMRGDVMRSLGRWEEATQSYDHSMQDWDGNPKTLRGLGFIALQSHANEDSLRFFKRAIAIQGEDSESILGVGLIYKRLCLNDEALFWLERCLNIDPNNNTAIAALSQACLESQTTDLGESTLKAAIELAGEKPALMMALGKLYMRAGKTEAGSKILALALGESS